MAVPASRLPDPVKLDDLFWSDVLKAYSALADTPISLPSWTSFKKHVLSLGSQSKARRKHRNTKHWVAALRGDQLSCDDLTSALRDMFSDQPATSSSPRCQWPPAAPSYASRPLHPYPSFVPTPESPWASTTVVPWKYCHSRSSPPSGVTFIPRPSTVESAAQIHQVLTSRIKSRHAAALKKAHLMTTKHTSEWYNLSSNKEADKQGSRASISMVGLRPSPNLPATPVLAEMVHIARSFFQSLHTPEPFTEARATAQATLLDKVHDEYSHIPTPPNVESGPFTMDEIPALFNSMPNTAPGPDGIPYSFWKSLHRRILAHNKEHPQSGLVPFWDSFLDLANDVKLNGSSRCGFKDANISLFFKKGEPTLTANYRPISSMNTDCKMYTNLINNRLSPWAVHKLHDDQKGFVPGRLITEHTRLASMVAHLAEATNSDGFIVSLNQAKAYDRVDQHWLLHVLSRMGLDPDLVSVIRDLTHKCRSRIRINGGYSPFFTLRRGVRQGDPLSCLLFNFSIEPLAMRLCHAIRGFSVLDLPPVKVMFYADDVNLFLSKDEPIAPIVACLDDTSFAIGSKFNHDKTDVKPIGTLAFQHACFDSGSLHGQSLPGSFILPPLPLSTSLVSGLAPPAWLMLDGHKSVVTSVGSYASGRLSALPFLIVSS